MYRGKQPAYVIGTLVVLIVVVGIALVVMTVDDGHSALTGSTVMNDEPEVDVDTIPELALGSVLRPLDLEGKEIVEAGFKEEILVGEYVVTVSHVKTMEKIGVYINPEQFQGVGADKMFYVIQVSVMLTGMKEGYVPKDMFRLSDGAYEYVLDEEASMYLFESNLLSQVMRSEVKRTGKIVFDVDEGIYDLLVYDNTNKVYRIPLDG